MWDLKPALVQRQQDNLYRQRRIVYSHQGTQLMVDGKLLLNFCSNDYLGLASNREIVNALRDTAAQYGVGAGASHLVCGHSEQHHALEAELANFLQRDRALLFSTGYMANLAVVSVLAGRQDAVFEDRLNHASLIDAARLSGAQCVRYTHADAQAVQQRLDSSEARHKLVITDAVFSMDGDLAPVAALADLCQTTDRALMLDDAHGFGVLGEDGRGTASHFGLDQNQVPVVMGTLGKAMGVFGAFVAGSEDLIESLVQFARPYIYTTALPPAVAGAVRASLSMSRREAWRREKLFENIDYFKQRAQTLGLPLMPSDTPIQPLLTGDVDRTLAASAALEAKGLLVTAIRPPTVPEGSARLRVTLTGTHKPEEIDTLLEALAECLLD